MKKKILVIDDEKAVRNSFLLTFEDSPCTVETAESGMEGLEKIRKEDYDLIMLDLKMPQMDGVETLRQIRKHNPSVLVYIFTAFHRDYFVQLDKAVKEGLSFEIVQKPLDSNQLHELVYSILSIKP